MSCIVLAARRIATTKTVRDCENEWVSETMRAASRRGAGDARNQICHRLASLSLVSDRGPLCPEEQWSGWLESCVVVLLLLPFASRCPTHVCRRVTVTQSDAGVGDADCAIDGQSRRRASGQHSLRDQHAPSSANPPFRAEQSLRDQHASAPGVCRRPDGAGRATRGSEPAERARQADGADCSLRASAVPETFASSS